MSIPGIIFLLLGIVLLGMGIYGGTVVIPEAADAAMPGALAQHLVQYKNLYLLLGAVILFIVIYVTIQKRVNLRVQHVMSTTIRYIILVVVGVFMVYPLLWMVSATFKNNNEIFSTLMEQILTLPVMACDPFSPEGDAVLTLILTANGADWTASFYQTESQEMARVISCVQEKTLYGQVKSWRIGTLLMACDGTRIQDESGNETPAQ